LTVTGGKTSAACSICSAGTYSDFRQTACSSCKAGTYATETGATSSAACIFVLHIFQFKAPYSPSEIIGDMQSRILLAAANVLGVNASSVVLTFESVLFDRRGQQAGVLISVGITAVQGSAASYASRVTQDKLNIAMAVAGLNNAQLFSIVGLFHDLQLG
jgi:hypothetical protein